jgi:hypothetical protein
VNPKGLAANSSVQSGPANNASLESAVGGPLGILHNYIKWTDPIPVASLQQEATQGTIPILDWHCGALDSAVSSGQEDSIITQAAQQLKAFGKPIFLRWYWEMNFTKGSAAKQCLGSSGASGYVAAWQHIWTIFHQVGATNVAFVWCPGNTKISTLAANYYPGNSYVDWIGDDSYALRPSATFADVISAFYGRWAQAGKPLMVGETGALPANQVSYLQSVATGLASQFTAIKALVYFDGSGPRANWSLQPAGLSEYRALAKSSFFSPKG